MARSRQADDCSLAGLGYSFTPVNLRPAPAGKGRSAGHAALGSGGADRAPAAAARAVAFNLRERRPGAAYGSPDAQRAAEINGKQRAEQAGAGGGAAQAALPPASSSLVQLKQASLRRRAAAAAAAASMPEPKCSIALLPVEPTTAPAAWERELPDAAPVGNQPAWETVDGHAAQLLQDMEALLAGCSAAVLQVPAPTVPQAQHMLLGRPVLAVPPPAPDMPAGGAAAVPAAASWLVQGTAAAQACASYGEAEEPDSIAAHRPLTNSGGGDAPAAEDCAPTADPLIEAAADCHDVPESLEQALRCLGLLASQHGAKAGSSGGTGQDSRAAGGAAEQQWVRLRAVQLAVAAKMAASRETELAPLVRRLRQVRLHLEFHKANLQRGRRRSPRRSTSPAAAAPPGPWLSGRSSAQDSKHRRSRSGSPGLQSRPKVGGPTQEASEVQVQLLTSLLHKLLLKLGLAVLRLAAASARLRRRLLAHAAALTNADTSRAVVLAWREAAVPSEQQTAAGTALAQTLHTRRQRAQMLAWREWAAQSAWQRQQLAAARGRLRHRLLYAAMQHWRCYCQQQLVRRLQAALAARWLAAWARRRAFTAWRQVARRSVQLKAALLLGRPCSNSSSSSTSQTAAGGQLGASQLEVLLATAKVFEPVKAFVAEARQQLSQLRQGLRFSWPDSAAAAESAEEYAAQRLLEASLEAEEPLPVGSVESLLALFPPPRLPKPAAAVHAPPATERAPLPAAHAAAVAAPAAAALAAAAAAEPAPDPGSPPPPYNPTSYASPQRQQGSKQQQPQQQRQPAELGDTAQFAGTPEAAEAELLECQQWVLRLRRELEDLEQESAALQQQCAELEAAAEAAEQAVGQRREACKAAAADKEEATAAMQAAVQQQTAAAADCAQRERQLQQRQQESQEAVAAAAGARAAGHAAAEREAVAAMAVQKWSKAVESAAKELAACHRSQQAPVLVRLKEARQQLERHQQEEQAARLQVPELQAAAQAAARRAQVAQQAVLDAQQQLLAAAEQRAARQKELDAAMGRHEAAAVAAVAAEQEASAAEQQTRLLAAQQQAAAAQLRRAAQQVLRKQQEAALLQQQVQLLQHRHQEALAAALAANRRQQQRRGKLKRRLQVVAEGAEEAVPSPTAVQQRRPPPAGACLRPAPQEGALHHLTAAFNGPDTAGAAEPAGSQLALSVPQPADWSCCSSELGRPQSDFLPAPPLTVEDAVLRFYTHSLLHRALQAMRSEACTAQTAVQAAVSCWQRRQQAAVLCAWRAHAAEAANWLAVTSAMLRRRWLLRRWRSVVAEQRWQQQAGQAADAFARRKLLAAGLAAWRQHVQHECWRDGVHEAVMFLRLRKMLHSWRLWTKQRRQKAARLRAALAVYHRRLLAAALQHWLWLHRSKALLRRVFSTAVELWQEEVGVRLHERNHARLQTCWSAWQLAVLEAQARRRQAMLWNAAVAFRERQLLVAGLQAFCQAVQRAHEGRRLARLQVHMFAEWRRLAASSARHWAYEAARRQRHHCLLRAALSAWRADTEATAEQLARFWLRWQAQAPLRCALLGWRWAVQARHEQRVLCGMAAVHRERRLLQAGLRAFFEAVHAARAAGSAGRGRSSAGSLTSAGYLACSSAGHSGVPQQHWQAGRHTVDVFVGSMPAEQQRQHQHQQHGPHGGGTTTTVTVSRGPRHWRGQEQVPPAGAASSRMPGAATASNCSTAASAGPVAAAAQGMLEAVSSWRAAADFWRQRHASYSQQQSQQRQR